MSSRTESQTVIHTRQTSWQHLQDVCGLVYVLSSACLGIYALVTFREYMDNNLYWPSFRSSSLQILLSDLLNMRLDTVLGGSATTVTLTGTLCASLDTNATLVSPTYARKIMYTEVSAVAPAITSIRQVDTIDIAGMAIPYCWVDLNRRWELAFTRARQARCDATERHNAAMYFEAVYRNVDFVEWVHTFYGPFMSSIGDAVQSTPHGVQWMTYMLQHSWVPVDDEATYWLSYNLTAFTLNWSNGHRPGISETFGIQNAVGVVRHIQIKTLAPEKVQEATWTSFSMAPSLLFGMTVLGENQSLVRNHANWFGAWDRLQMTQLIAQNNFDIGRGAVASQVGPLGAIDMKFLDVPTALRLYVESFEAQVNTLMQSNNRFRLAFESTPPQSVFPTPQQWINSALSFTGGALFCLGGHPTLFAQESFRFDDPCNGDVDQRLSVVWSPTTSLFAATLVDAVAWSQAATLCDSSDPCHHLFGVSSMVFDALAPLSNTNTTLTVIDRTAAMNISIMQFVYTGFDVQIASQPSILEGDPWSVFGWMMVYEWVTGSREVVAFHGDIATLTLISRQYSPAVSTISDRSITQSFAAYLWWVALYVSVVLGFVALLTSATWVPSQHSLQRNWFVFNRVAGSNWIGRPFLVVRGIVAMLCLATAPASRSSFGDLSVLVDTRRSAWISMMLSGESLWVTYVLNELLCHATAPYTRLYAPTSCLLVWTMYVFVDVAFPPSLVTTMDRQCQVTAISSNVVCSSGTLSVGHPSRLLVLGCIHVMSIVVTASVVRACHRIHVASYSPTLLLPGAVMAFMNEAGGCLGFWSLDSASLAMCGILRFSWRSDVYLFDINLWLLMQTDHFEFKRCDPVLRFPHAFERLVIACRSGVASTRTSAKVQSATMIKIFKLPHSIRRSLGNPSKSTELRKPARLTMAFPTHSPFVDVLLIENNSIRKTIKAKLLAVVVLLYVLCTLVGSIVYAMETAAAILGNDFYWAEFSTAHTHVFLANVINLHALNTRSGVLPLNSATLMASTSPNNGSAVDSTIVFSDTLGHRELYETQPLDKVIGNLRLMDPCAMPYMFTQYCWVDFGMQWEMAATSARQARCQQRMRSNGAVYMEGVLRNFRSWSEWETCWGSAFHVGVGLTLAKTLIGRTWLASTKLASSLMGGVATEVAYWRNTHNITEFVLQWQSMRSVGMSDVVRIKNALGFEYPITLNSKLTKFSPAQPTSVKMYWGFAGDLWAISSNGTQVTGLSLVRSSSEFAFANVTREMLLADNYTFQTPYISGLAQFTTSVGPFGVVDMVYVACPHELSRASIALVDALSTLIYNDETAHSDFDAVPHKNYITMFPFQWLGGAIRVTGGDLMCGNDNPTMLALTPQETQLYTGFSTSKPCETSSVEEFAPDEYLALFALLAFDANHHLAPADLVDFCTMDTYAESDCASSYAETFRFSAKYNATFFPLQAAMTKAYEAVRPLHVDFLQFIVNTTEPSLFRLELLDKTHSNRAWLFVSWCYLYDWVAGQREVVSFQGDVGTITTVSASYTAQSFLPKPSEVPTDLSLVLWTCVQYMTVLICVLAFFVFAYAVAARGNVEEANIFRMSRLVGLVWAGRPFLFARSISAMLYLNTATLLLEDRGGVLGFESVPQLWYNMMLASVELQWFVFVLNDAFSCVTQHYTSFYAGKSAWVASFAVWVWMQLRPNVVDAQLDRVCAAVNMDYALHCDSGVVEIGRVSYVFSSMGICLASVVGTFVVEKYIRQTDTALDIPSLLLSSQAKYVLNLSGWIWCGTYYMDKSTALMAGVISLEWNHKLYMFDIKKWRHFVVCRSALNDAAPDKLRHAIPILE
ncbi:hypothetical protein DYB37_008189 [Aphanomyces astaci]|uniref:Transmembrane protein n=1 Tax=Aphanomyces astaci TaxID=112090 RepID=A0A3R7B6N3_APHAT|nr:hypothetical protein DYB35_010369 [Aphanomyces astaci]RHZ29569.1 hypothetical protein DYB37_008189 [Aphanomyces astaci]